MLPDFRKIYSGKKVFVTGHTGFKGTWLINWLYLLGAEVKGYALQPENEFDLFNSSSSEKICHSVISDIRDKTNLTAELIKFSPDFIFHLAAQPLVRLSYELPNVTFEINAQGTANLLDAIRLLKKPCIALMITTDKVYHNFEMEYCYKEDDRLGGYDPYSSSKACAELIIDSYRNSFFHPDQYNIHQKSISVARAGNVIGGGDWAKDRIIPDIIRGLVNKKTIEISNPSSIRPWQFVLEPLYGYLLLAAKMYHFPTDYCSAFNFGPFENDVLTVEELVKTALKVWGTGDYIYSNISNSSHEAGILKLNIQKSITQLGWKPKWSSQLAIKKTIAWYSEYLNSPNQAADIIKKTIEEYQSSEN
jgi:CDP-glucose 4,6-dehydratase